MIKGGFQGLDISGVDLTAQSPTLPGAYAACAAADGKTVLVLTAAGAVQCSVKKVSTNYVLAGITGDGKILSITIGGTDGIAVSESVPSSESTVKGLGTRSIITSSYTDEEPFTAPVDGYIKMHYLANTDEGCNTTMYILKSTGTYEPFLIVNSSGKNESLALFVRKGTKMYATDNVARAAVSFYPIVNE